MKLFLFSIISVVLLLRNVKCQKAEIYAVKATIVINEDNVSIICRPKMNGLGFRKIFGIQLKRNVDSIPQQIVSASIGSDSLIWHDGSLEARGRASFNISSVSTAYLKLLIEKHAVTCNDGSHYICEITGQFDDLSNGIKSAYKDINIRVNPDNIDDISVCPKNKGHPGVYYVGEHIELMCRSTVGYPARNILWCIKRNTENAFSPIPVSDERFHQEDPVLVGCQSERKGFLKYTVTNEDDETIFMCKASDFQSSNDCSVDTPKKLFILRKDSTKSIIRVCNSLVNEGKVKNDMKIDGIDIKRPQSSTNINSVGSSLTLTCIGHTSGSMSTLNIHWCIKRSFDDAFYEYPFGGNIVNSAVESSGVCKYSRTSALHYNVTNADIETQLMCQLGVTEMKSVCGLGRLSKTLYIRLIKEDTTTKSSLETIKQPQSCSGISIEHVSNLATKISFNRLFLLIILLNLKAIGL